MEQEQKKDRTLLNVLFAGMGCLVLIGVIAVIGFGKLFSTVQAPSRTVHAHLAAISNGEYDLAYSHFTAEYQKRVSPAEFRESLSDFSSQLPYRDVNINSVNVENDRAEVDGTITGKDGSIFPVSYRLEQIDGKWKISDYTWTPPGEQQTI